MSGSNGGQVARIFGGVGLSCLMAVGLGGCASPTPQVKPTPAATAWPAISTPRLKVGTYLTNQLAFENIQAAVRADTFAEAQHRLEAIKEAQLKDPELLEYYRLSDGLVAFCHDLEVPRTPQTALADVMFSLDYAAIHRRVAAVSAAAAQEDEPLARARLRRLARIGGLDKEATRLVEEALRLQRQLPHYRALEASLTRKYGGD